MDGERQRIISEARRILDEIDQIFADARHWNENTRPRLYPDAAPIDPDPDGQMAAFREGIAAMLRKESHE